MLVAFIGIVCVTFFGWLFTQIIYPKAVFLEQLALGYLFGFGLFTYVLFLANLARVPYALVQSSLILVGLSVICLGILAIKKQNIVDIFLSKLRIFQEVEPLVSLEKTLTVALIAVMSLTIFLSSYWPVKDWDSLVLYDFRARTFAYTGFMDTGLKLGYFLGYPLFTSLSHTWMYLLGFQYPGITHSLLYCSLLILMYTALRKHASRSWALLWTLIFCFSSGLFDHALMTYTNLAYCVFLVTGYYYLFEWLRDRRFSDLSVSAFLVGLSTWSRSAEPFWLVLVAIVVVASLLKKEWREAIFYPVVILIIRQPWQIFEKAHAQPTVLLGKQAEAAATFAKIPLIEKVLSRLTPMGVWEVLYYYWQNVVFSNRQMYLIFILVSSILFLKIRKKQATLINIIIFIVILTNILGVLAGIYEFSIFYREWKDVGGSAERMSLFFTPLIVFFTASVTYQLFEDQVPARVEKRKISARKKRN